MKTRYLQISATLFLFAISTACVFGDQEEKQLKEPTDKDQETTQADAGKADQTSTPKPKRETVNADSVMKWQNFFKPTPSTAEAAELSKTLENWTDDKSAESLIKKGKTAAALGKVSLAESLLRQAIRIDPRNPEAALELSGVYIRKNEHALAFEFLGKANQFISKDDKEKVEFEVRYTYLKGLALLAKDDTKEGRAVLSELIKTHKNFTPGYSALANSYLQFGKVDIAEFVILRGLDKNPNDANLLNLMGSVHIYNNRMDEAKTWIEKSLKADPYYPSALVNRARIHMNNMEHAAAENDLINAIGSNQRFVDALTTLGVLYKRMKRFSESKSVLTKAIEIEPRNPSPRYNLAVLLAEDLKRPNVALRLFREVLQTAPQHSPPYKQASEYVDDIQLSHYITKD